MTAPAPAEYLPKIGLDKLYVAEVTVDSLSTYTADTPAYLAPAAEASQEPTTSLETFYYDDKPSLVISSEGQTNIKLVVSGIDLAMLAQITGRVYDDATGRFYDNGGVPPDMALSFRSMKANGSFRYYQYLKGKFDMPKEDTATKGEKPDPKNMELTYSAISTTCQFDLGDVIDSVKRIIGDEDVTNFDASGWFDEVQTPDLVTSS